MKKMLTVVTTAKNASSYARNVLNEIETINYALRVLAVVKMIKDEKFVGILQ